MKMKNNIVERRFTGIYSNGQLDIITVKTERSKPLRAIAKLIDEHFIIAQEVTASEKGKIGDYVPKAESRNKSCKTNSSHPPQKIGNTIPSPYPLTEVLL